MKSEPILKNRLWEFARGDIDPVIFETWLYVNQELDSLIGEELYLQLISCNFSNQEEVFQSRKAIVTAFTPNMECECPRIRNVSGVRLYKSEFYEDLYYWSYDDFVATQVIIFGPNAEFEGHYISRCNVCDTNWLVQHDERHFEGFNVERVSEQIVIDAREGFWPPPGTNAFQRYNALHKK